jgi:uncharacterized protein (TIGR03000 family)
LGSASGIGYHPNTGLSAGFGFQSRIGFTPVFGYHPFAGRGFGFVAPAQPSFSPTPLPFSSHPEYGYRPNWTNGYSPAYGYYNTFGTPYYYGHDPSSLYREPQPTKQETNPSLIPTPENTRSLPDTRAHLNIKVPATAQVWFDGKKTTGKGQVREFRSPPLETGYDYTYEIRVRWAEGGREITQTRKVNVTAGARQEVDFTARDTTKPGADKESR